MVGIARSPVISVSPAQEACFCIGPASKAMATSLLTIRASRKELIAPKSPKPHFLLYMAVWPDLTHGKCSYGYFKISILTFGKVDIFENVETTKQYIAIYTHIYNFVWWG